MFCLYMQDSVLNSINTNICLFALVPAEVCHFEAQAAFQCYLFIFLVEKKSAQVIFVLDKFSWVCVYAFSCNSRNFVCFKKWYFRFLCDFVSHIWKSSVALQCLEWGPMQSKSHEGFGYLECSTHAQ